MRLSRAENDVLAERRRQVRGEGWSARHDDQHDDGSLAMVAALYALPRDDLKIVNHTAELVAFADPWPSTWAAKWDKRRHHARRKRLLIAGALILAELERMDRRQQWIADGGARGLGKAWRRWLARCDQWLSRGGSRFPPPPANMWRPLIRAKLVEPPKLIKPVETFGRVVK